LKRIGICGAFDFKTLDHGGQPVKTRQLYYELCKSHGKENIEFVEMFKMNHFRIFAGCIRMMFRCSDVIILPAHSGVQSLLPLLAVLNFVFRKKLSYVVIGGWLPSMLEAKGWLKFFLQRMHGIYVETSFMEKKLRENGLLNVYVLPNPKDLTPIPEEELAPCTEPIALCTFARVMEKKGIEDAIRAVKQINKEKVLATLDIYGLIDSSYQERFAELQKDFPDYIRYGGAVPFEEAVSVLKKYVLQLFPTKFPTEGIPGSIVDGYFAGLPVLASKWESFADVVEDGVTGVGFEFENYDDFVAKLQDLIAQPEKLARLKQNARQRAIQYRAECDEKIREYFLRS